MKFFTSVVALATIASVYASPMLTPRQENTEEQLQNTSEIIKSLPPECQKEIELYADCNVNINLSNYEKCCSETCINFFKDPFKYIPSCKGNTLIDSTLTPETLEVTNNNLLLECAKDEQGNKCPFSKVLINEVNGVTNNIYDETCLSKACTDATYQHYSYNLDHVDSNPLYTEAEKQKTKNSLNETLRRLKLDECVSKHQLKDNTSDATMVKVSTTFIVSFGLLLLSYL
ncbi:hypothetical protein PIROE2DRAFT_10612 [Piromyces sp. E2]|nr:hypothetical protein PIROE2DRAFT_10612 [Piromyces sp. E2]|eukprot:OUM62980.1 hypothetical protein PIROE2DRAFT_10612 [Piromyces sp. E2]